MWDSLVLTLKTRYLVITTLAHAQMFQTAVLLPRSFCIFLNSQSKAEIETVYKHLDRLVLVFCSTLPLIFMSCTSSTSCRTVSSLISSFRMNGPWANRYSSSLFSSVYSDLFCLSDRQPCAQRELGSFALHIFTLQCMYTNSCSPKNLNASRLNFLFLWSSDEMYSTVSSVVHLEKKDKKVSNLQTTTSDDL